MTYFQNTTSLETISFFSFFRLLIKSLLAPLPIFWLLLVIALVFYFGRKKRIARWFLVSSLFWLFLISTPFLPKFLMATLENQFPPVQLLNNNNNLDSVNDSIVNILVLGSGYETDDRLSYSAQLGLSALARMAEGIRLQRLIPSSNLIFSGYANFQPLPMAKVSAMAAQEMGIDSSFIQTICEPWNTKTEAEEYFKRFGTDTKLYLVTDAAHIPRAVVHFRRAGLNPIPAPTNFNIKKNNIPKRYTYYFPSSDNIKLMEIASVEYLGILWAKIGGD